MFEARILLEPGHASFEVLNQLTARHFSETQLYRLDHYLGKEVILNIPTLRWANRMFEPIWNAEHVNTGLHRMAHGTSIAYARVSSGRLLR